MLRTLTVLMFGLCLASHSHAAANSSIFFHCEGSGIKYQIIFEHEEATKNLVQRIQEPHPIEQGEVGREIETILTEFEISNDFVNYLKNKNRFSISRLTGKVLRDNQDVPLQCIEKPSDYFATIRGEVKNANHHNGARPQPQVMQIPGRPAWHDCNCR